MAAKTITPEQKRAQEKQTVGLMIALYCHGNHGTPKGTLCPDCAALQEYADARVELPTYGRKDLLQRLQDPLLQAGNAAAHP